MKLNPLLILCLLLFINSAFSQSLKSEKYHEFDFWLGEWNVYKYGTDTLVGQSVIESIIDSVGILENYTTGRYKGKSLNKYNSITGQWEQFWIDNSGLTLKLSGGLEGQKMVMENREEKGGDIIRNRITWSPLDQNKVRQVWEISQDDGNTWQKVFDGLYIPKDQDK